MSLSKDDLLKRREELAADYDKAVAEIEKGEAQIMDLESYETLTAHFPDKLAENIAEGGTVAYVEYKKDCTITDARTYK